MSELYAKLRQTYRTDPSDVASLLAIASELEAAGDPLGEWIALSTQFEQAQQQSEPDIVARVPKPKPKAWPAEVRPSTSLLHKLCVYGIDTPQKLAELRREQLAKIPGVGRKTLGRLEGALKVCGLSLAPDLFRLRGMVQAQCPAWLEALRQDLAPLPTTLDLRSGLPHTLRPWTPLPVPALLTEHAMLRDFLVNLNWMATQADLDALVEHRPPLRDLLGERSREAEEAVALTLRPDLFEAFPQLERAFFGGRSIELDAPFSAPAIVYMRLTAYETLTPASLQHLLASELPALETLKLQPLDSAGAHVLLDRPERLSSWTLEINDARLEPGLVEALAQASQALWFEGVHHELG